MGLRFPGRAIVSVHNIRNNVSRFQKEPEISNLILVRSRNKIHRQQDRVHEEPSNHQIKHEAEMDSTPNDKLQ